MTADLFNKPEAVRSVYDDQADILRGISDLYLDGGRFDVDACYGNGRFWTRLQRPEHCFDVEPLHPCVTESTSTGLPLDAGSVGSVVFDPPFLTYVRAGRHGNGSCVMAQRFGGYWTYDELREHYTASLHEFARVLRPGGIVVVKCQDIVHNHRLHPTHVNVIAWGDAAGFRLLDLFVLPAKRRIPRINQAGKQKHSRIWHSHFIVLRKRTDREQPGIAGIC